MVPQRPPDPAFYARPAHRLRQRTRRDRRKVARAVGYRQVLDAMRDATRDTPTVSEPMSWSEIRERFPDQWIALVALDWADERDEPFYTALVAGHGSHREALDQAKPLLELFTGIGPFFTGDATPVVPELPPIVYVA